MSSNFLELCYSAQESEASLLEALGLGGAASKDDDVRRECEGSLPPRPTLQQLCLFGIERLF